MITFRPPRWTWRDEPFRHLTATDVFDPTTYARLVASYRTILARGLDDSPGRASEVPVFRKVPWGRTAYACVLTSVARGFEPFLGADWHDAIARRFGIEATGEVSVALHHHRPGGANGRPHNDLGPGWFVDRPRSATGGERTVNVHDPTINSYPTGRRYRLDVRVHESVRAIAILYYLDNPVWQEGDGGETGLYRSATDPVDAPAARVAPRGNSLLAFECTPSSYHCFLGNRRHPRSSLTMWLHRSKADVIRRWGERAVGSWARPLPTASSPP